MEEFRRTIGRRDKLINFIEKRLGEVEYNNEPIGYCLNEECTMYKDDYHDEMKSGMLDGIAKIEKALRLIKLSIEYSTLKDKNKL